MYNTNTIDTRGRAYDTTGDPSYFKIEFKVGLLANNLLYYIFVSPDRLFAMLEAFRQAMSNPADTAIAHIKSEEGSQVYDVFSTLLLWTSSVSVRTDSSDE